MQKIIYYKKTQLKKPSSFRFAIFILVFLLILVPIYTFVLNNQEDYSKTPIISPLAQVVEKSAHFINSRQNSKTLQDIVQSILKEDIDNYGIVIDNLKTGERYYFNENKIFDTGSLYKLWVMAVVYQKIEEGKLKETDILSQDVVVLNEKFNISSEAAELTEGTISWPVQNALEQMISVSDNYSALLLAEKIGLSSVAGFLREYGLSKSKAGGKDTNPVSSADDVASFFRQLYDGKLVSADSTLKMINLLKKQRINTKLAGSLPSEVVIAHKTGELGGFSHDAGIVYTPKGDYLIVIMSKTDNRPLANEKIKEISKNVYEYFIN